LDTLKRTETEQTEHPKKANDTQHIQHLKKAMDLRKKENPRTHLVGFKTDKTTQERIRHGAQKAGVPVSQFIHDKLKGQL